VRALVTPNGAITEVWHYDSWGNILSMPTQRVEQPFLWNGAYGYEYIPFTGLYRVGAREYDPAPHAGCNETRLVSADPSGLQSDDLYDNPIDEEGRPIFYKKTYASSASLRSSGISAVLRLCCSIRVWMNASHSWGLPSAWYDRLTTSSQSAASG